MIQNQFIVPEKIDFNLILNSKAYSDHYIENHIDKYNYVIHTILEKQVINRSADSHGYSNINKQILRDFIGKRYADAIIEELVAEHVIQRSYYVPGVKSFGYRIDPQYMSKATLRNVFKEEIWDKKLAKQNEAYQSKLKKSVEFKNLSKLRIDHKKAYAFVETKYTNTVTVLERNEAQLSTIHAVTDPMFRAMYACVKMELSECKPAYALPSLRDTEKALAHAQNAELSLYHILTNAVLSQHSSDLISIGKIVDCKFFIEQPDPESRIFTNVTNMSTDLRQFLRIDRIKSTLVNMDIRNSQPYLFSLLLMDRYRGMTLPADVEKYIQLTASGEFYEYVMNLLGIDAADRSAFKIQFFAKIFFCTTYYSKRTVDGKLFASEFPNVYKLINEYKETAYEDLAIAMQRKEAGVILKSIAGELKKQKIWFATIHDSVVCMEEHADYVKQLILASFMDAVGIPPTVTSEPLKPVDWLYSLN
jgi:hypothetical protein